MKNTKETDTKRTLVNARQYLVNVKSAPFQRISERDRQGDIDALDILGSALSEVLKNG